MANPNVTKWIPPLPPGWEGRWDANQRAYFFIDHATKKTTWVDPRFDEAVTAQPPFPPKKNMYEAQTMPGLSPEPTFVVDETITTMANNIHKDYPRVPLDTIRDIISACNVNEQESRVTLTRMGYQKGGDTSGASLSANEHAARPKSTARGKAKAKSPARSPARSPSPAPAPAPAPVSEAEKKRIVSKLKSEFPALDPVVVSMALDVCEHKESQARIILKGWGDTNNKTRSPPKSGTGTTTTEFAASASLDPVAFDYDDRPSSKKSSSRPSNGHKASPTGHQASPSGRKSSQPKKTTSVATSHPGHKRNKPTHVTQQTRPRHQVVTHQPRTDSINRTHTNGPNPEIRMGADKSLLLSEYTFVHGPNSSNRQGPDHTRVYGALGGTGPDPANHCGAQSMGNSGPQIIHTPYLVTSI